MRLMRARRNPDPSQGIFETMLVLDGAAIAPGAHLARLEASLEAVYGAELPASATQIVSEHAEGLELGRVRLTFVPGLGVEVEAGEIDRSLHFSERPISLRSHPVAGGLGCHKWADRAAIPESHEGSAVLLVDGDEVLEAGRANVFAIRAGALFTPPLDGRILPGVTRATMIELARGEGLDVAEGVLTLDEMSGSEEVFLTNSIRGVETVDSVDGTPLTGGHPLTDRLAEAMRGRWESEARPVRAPALAAARPPDPPAG
jgi:para-aminobenzoate synthetase / 4-amino-4-deoxychorismate lyase